MSDEEREKDLHWKGNKPFRMDENDLPFHINEFEKLSKEKEETEFISYVFCSLLISKIKNIIKINNNEFDRYIQNIDIDVDLLLHNLFQKSTILELLQRANIKRNKNTFIQAERCTQTISLALLKCDNYDDLFDSLTELIKKKHATVWNLIKKYIPLLEVLNQDINTEKWLPNSKTKIDYKLLKKKVEDLSNTVTGVTGSLIKPKNEKQWFTMIKNISRKNEIPKLLNAINAKMNLIQHTII